ncbi:hypothetical protein R1sor_027540 [Riccia sorocarpa]|uniref:Uncharacterized protein n=1 Tax=Riccia sorocarpa TaxID=122646 RepID=A0ABD3GG93_9MARC
MADEEQELRVADDGGEDDVDDQQQGVPNLEPGNAAFRRGKFEEAIKWYTEALIAQPADPAVLLSNRCAAYCKLSERLRKIPAELSEKRAIFGLDPMSLVQLGLKDAEKLLKWRKEWPKAYLRKGSALVLLEQYEEARDAFLDGLQLDPANKALQNALRNLNADSGAQPEQENSQQQKRGKLERLDELDCTLCLKLLYSPVTTPCGHSFCRACLLEAMKHGNKCPMCRTVLFVSPRTYPVSVTLNNLIQRNFPEEYKERKVEMDAVSLGGEEILPLFVMDILLPAQRTALNIFEPRYRLMVRRVMEGNHRMGMVGLDDTTGTLTTVGCEVEIRECQLLPDGRFHIEIEGRRRFRINRTWDQDGYRVAQVQWIEDTPLEEGSSEREEVSDLLKKVSALAKLWFQRAEFLSRHDRRAIMNMVVDMAKQVENTPDISQAESFSFSIANLLHTSPQERLQLLSTTDTRERLEREMELLRQGSHECCVQ